MDYHVICPPSAIVPFWSGSDRRYIPSDKCVSHVVLRARSRPAAFPAHPPIISDGKSFVVALCMRDAAAIPYRFSVPSGNRCLGSACRIMYTKIYPPAACSRNLFSDLNPRSFFGDVVFKYVSVYTVSISMSSYTQIDRNRYIAEMHTLPCPAQALLSITFSGPPPPPVLWGHPR